MYIWMKFQFHFYWFITFAGKVNNLFFISIDFLFLDLHWSLDFFSCWRIMRLNVSFWCLASHLAVFLIELIYNERCFEEHIGILKWLVYKDCSNMMNIIYINILYKQQTVSKSLSTAKNIHQVQWTKGKTKTIKYGNEVPHSFKFCCLSYIFRKLLQGKHFKSCRIIFDGAN